MRWQLVEMSATAAGQPVGTFEVEREAPVSRLFSNSVAMGAANVVGRGLGYTYVVLMARHLDARYLGAYAILITASMLVELVSNLGLDKILVREIASCPANVGQGYFWAALPIRLVMASLSVVVAWTLLVAWFRGQLLASPLSCGLFLFTIFPVVATRNCEAFLTAHERCYPSRLRSYARRW